MITKYTCSENRGILAPVSNTSVSNTTKGTLCTHKLHQSANISLYKELRREYMHVSQSCLMQRKLKIRPQIFWVFIHVFMILSPSNQLFCSILWLHYKKEKKQSVVFLQICLFWANFVLNLSIMFKLLFDNSHHKNWQYNLFQFNLLQDSILLQTCKPNADVTMIFEIAKLGWEKKLLDCLCWNNTSISSFSVFLWGKTWHFLPVSQHPQPRIFDRSWY